MEDGMTRAFAKEFAAMLGKVPRKLATLHAPASDPHRNGLSSRVVSTRRCQLAIGFENQPEGLPKIPPDFGQGSPLGIHPRHFLNVGNIPSPALLNHRRKFSFHGNFLLRF
jgi:hypothetical protein